MTLEELEHFATTYELIKAKADSLFDALDQLDKRYKLPNSYSLDGWYSFDNFTVESDYIDLNGRLSVQGDAGSKSYMLYLQEFLNYNEYLDSYEQKLKDRLEGYHQKQRDRKKREEQREHETFLKLKAKYEGNI